MADKNQLKVADQVDLADDDPFAELTRIMGFDPRQPVRPADAPQPASVEQAAGDDDFSLDLEKELLGGFDLEDELADTDNAPAEAAAPAHETPAPETLDAAPEPEATAFDIPAAEMPEVDFDFSADFDAAMAASDEDGAAAADADFDLGLTEDDVRALDVPESREQPAADVKTAVDAEADFDLGLTMDDVRALDAETAQSTASSKADAGNWNAGRGDADDRDIDADLDAALADIDMDFLRDAAAPEPARPEPVDEAPAVLQDEDAGEADLHLFDEEDFRLDDIAASAVEAEPEPEQESEPESHASVLSFGEDDLRLDDAHPAGEQAAQLAEEEFSFDDADFMADLSVSTEPEAAWPESVEVETAAPEIYQPERVAEEPPAEPDLSVQAESASAQHFELPRYEPRKLPVSPMDVAAEEFRQREAAVAPAAPEFNLEDELNALLGNIRAGQQEASSPAAPVPEPEPFVASSYAPPAYEPPPADLHQPAASSTDETGPYETGSYEASHPAVEPQHGHASEPISFDAPSEPADIEDNLSWELDDAFAADGGPEQAEDEQPSYGPSEAYAQGDHPEAYAQDGRHDPYAEAGQIDDAYSVEEPAPDFVDETWDQPPEEVAQPEPSPYHGSVLGGAAFGAAAASRFDSGFAARPSEAGAPDRFAAHPQTAAEPEGFTPHRDPVVRGNPLKEDPLDIITALAAKYSKKEPITPYGRAMGVATGTAAFGDDEDIDISSAFEEQPEVETIEVADRAVALADDLDIPELVEEELPPAAYDDLDAEFSSLLGDMNAEQRAASQTAGGDPLAGGFEAHPYQAAPNAPRQEAQPASSAYDDDAEPDMFALDADALPGSRAPSGTQYGADEYGYDPDLDQEIAAPHHLAAESRQQPKSRGLLLAGIVGGVALVGAIGAFALSFGDGNGSDTPAIVRADDGPVKVKPENPGGATVPNQDNKVYETVAGEGTADQPQQETLVTTAEEPVDVTPPPALDEETASASGKNEDRIEQILQEAENQTDAEIVAVAPRKVRTLVVRPDGTLVERADEPDAAPSGEQTDTVAAAVPDAPAPMIPESTGALPAAPDAQAAQEPASGELPPVEEEASGGTGVMPETVPIAPMRPADQPIDIVGEVKPDQVAAATVAAPDGNWAMQIASQPSEAAAQSSYQNLARRYGAVLEGREVNIVKAEIEGKGTYWRVRVPAGSRNEAISLCENYKAAGGNCFVSR